MITIRKLAPWVVFGAFVAALVPGGPNDWFWWAWVTAAWISIVLAMTIYPSQ